jgi:uncharacterized metal-binding protein
MTNKEYYSFKLATAKQFNKLVESTYKNLDNKEIILNGKVDQKETDKFKKEKVSEMLNYSKKLAFKEIQAKSGFTPPITNDNKIVRDAELKTEKLIKKLEALGADIFIELKTND